MLKKRVKSHVVEWFLFFLMFLFGTAAVYIFIAALEIKDPDPTIIVIELLLLILVALLAMTTVLVKIYEQHMVPYYLHKKTHDLIKK